MTIILSAESVEFAAFANHQLCNLLFSYCFGHESIAAIAFASRLAEG